MANRELDNATPNFVLTDEEAEQLKKDLNDPVALERTRKELEEEDKQYDKDLQYMCETGLDLDGNKIPSYLLKQIKQHYEKRQKHKGETI